MASYTFAALAPGYARLWSGMTINEKNRAEFKALASALYRNISHYEQVEAITGVPAALIAVIHNREASANFRSYLGNGEPLTRVTRLVPRGRGPFVSWEAGAIDAIKYDGLDQVKKWTVERACFEMEKYNGFGYRQFAANDEDGLVDSPYLWAGTNVQDPGKYTSDGKFNRSAWDSQLGCVPLLASIWALDPMLRLPMENGPALSPLLPEPHIPPPRIVPKKYEEPGPPPRLPDAEPTSPPSEAGFPFLDQIRKWFAGWR